MCLTMKFPISNIFGMNSSRNNIAIIAAMASLVQSVSGSSCHFLFPCHLFRMFSNIQIFPNFCGGV